MYAAPRCSTPPHDAPGGGPSLSATCACVQCKTAARMEAFDERASAVALARARAAARGVPSTTAAPVARAASAATPTAPIAAAAAGAASAPPADVPEDPTTNHRVLALLERHKATFRTLTHAPTKTSEESAAVRGVPLASGAKAMLLKGPKEFAHGGCFILAVMSAAKSVSWSKIRKLVGTPKLALASLEDVAATTGCVPGAVPPFGSLFAGA